MLVRIQHEPYVNFLELAWILIKREFFTAMEFLQFFDQEDRSWNGRAIWWYAIATAITSVFFSSLTPVIPAILFSMLCIGAVTRFLQVSRWK